MRDPIVAIVGSVDPARQQDYKPPLANLGDAQVAAEEIGGELARAGYRIMVYSAKPAFIEAAVVKGYVASGKAKPESILYYPPARGAEAIPEFPEQQQETSRPYFHSERAIHEDWEIPFYESLQHADAVLLLGGARSVLITGIVALSSGKPMLAIATFGGSAERVWQLMRAGPEAEARRQGLDAMGRLCWSDGAAKELVAILGAERERRFVEQEARRRTSKHERRCDLAGLLSAGLSVLAAVALTELAIFGNAQSRLLFGACFFGTPLLAGLAGGLVRAYRTRSSNEAGTGVRRSLVGAAVLGMIAGLVAALLFVLAQMASNPELKVLANRVPDGLPLLVPFAFLIAFVGGMTLEAVFGKLEKTNVVNTGPVAAPTAASSE